ncbi:hypothetical protein EDC94DRAFT_289463 [Helicostylum pulchrum]|nr:hypothetical protein EDC94DRAFT_289463 [Helicostylum pulchrum]
MSSFIVILLFSVSLYPTQKMLSRNIAHGIFVQFSLQLVRAKVILPVIKITPFDIPNIYKLYALDYLTLRELISIISHLITSNLNCFSKVPLYKKV